MRSLITISLLISSILSLTPTEYMEKLRNDIVTPAPTDILVKLNNIDYGKIQKITYYSKDAKREKYANVLLPAGYGNGEKFPVLYVNHGIYGDEDDMLGEDMGIQTMSANLFAKGLAEKMIIVSPNMWTHKTLEKPSRPITDEVEEAYDAFLGDIVHSLIPYMEQNFDIKTGRENTAISGFSMGAREALYIGVSRPDIFGYIGAACPAPGIVPGYDFMYHKGSMAEEDFKIKDLDNYPYIIFITGGDNDLAVGTFPKQYSELLTKNGCDNVFQLVPGGDHSGYSGRSHFYNFLRYIFRADKQ